jgi:hypothetical protein
MIRRRHEYGLEAHAASPSAAKGTLTHSIWRAVVAAFSFGIPLVAMALPGWERITLGGLVYAILHYAQSQAGL